MKKLLDSMYLNRKCFVLSLLMSVGWGQSTTEKYTQEIILNSENEKMIISNHEMEGYTFSDTSYISFSRLLTPCNGEYTEIDSSCYYQNDINVLEIFINNSDSTLNPYLDYNDNGVIEPLELGVQEWNNGHLIYLDLSHTGIIGEIPIELWNMNELIYLDLGNHSNFGGIRNNIVGEIPSQIENLNNLMVLKIMFSGLTGQIPSEIGNLNSLENLSLWSNQISGEIPNEISNLINLNTLRLSQNQLSGQIPLGLWDLTNLTSLSLSQNQLAVEIPPEIGNLVNLNALDFYSMGLSGEIPPEIGNLINLGYLRLSYNNLIGEIPSEIGNLTNLYSLNLNNNQLSGYIPETICNINDNTPELHNNYLCPPFPECLIPNIYGQYLGNCEGVDDFGCTDPEAPNFDSEAIIYDGSCDGYVNLFNVQISGENFAIEYSKNFQTCVHLYNNFGQILHNNNWFCETGSHVIRILNTSQLYDIELGDLVNLRHGNGQTPPSEYKLVTDGGCTNQESINYDSFAILDDGSCIQQYQLGDVNQNEYINILDLTILIGYILEYTELDSYQFELGDINADGNITIVDIIMIMNMIFSQ